MRSDLIIILSSCLLVLSACTKYTRKPLNQSISTQRKDSVIVPQKKPYSQMAHYMDSLGLTNINKADSTIKVNLMYATPDNFTGRKLYDDLTDAYLHPDAAKALIKAQQALRKRQSSFRLIIYDAARPMSIQKKMWDVVKGTSKYMYVSNPDHGGGLHNYGLAVDISISDSLGTPLSMGTEVDHMGTESHITQEMDLIRVGKITEQERQNRILLRQVMKEGGFRTLPTEWWHFNLCSRSTARQKYQLIP